MHRADLRRARLGTGTAARVLSEPQRRLLALIIERTQRCERLPPYRQIADAIGCSENGVGAALDALLAKGCILYIAGKRGRHAAVPVPLRDLNGDPLAVAWLAIPDTLEGVKRIGRERAGRRAGELADVCLRVLSGQTITTRVTAALVDLLEAGVAGDLEPPAVVMQLLQRIHL
jgi:hypothetical protein